MIATAAKPANKTNLPTYRLRKGYSQAIVTLTDSISGKRKDYWLGEFGSPGSREMYHRVLSQWESLDRRLPPPTSTLDFTPVMVPPTALQGGSSTAIRGLAVSDVIRTYREHVDVTFKPPTQATINMVLNLLKQVFGSTAADQFGPSKLRLLRDQMIKGDPRNPHRKPWSRTTVNKAVHQVCAMFRWAASHEMLPVTIHTHLKTVAALRRGQSAASENDPVQPVPMKVVDATKPHLNRQVRALVELQLLTGARGGELLKLRPIDIQKDSGGKVWTIRPLDHKTAHHGHDRTLFLGPKAQLIIQPFLTGRPPEDYLFSPAEAERERREAASRKRKSPLARGHRPGTNRRVNPKRKPGDYYTSAAYRHAIECACIKAGVPRWHPHQLRHTAGTLIRREFGLEAARIILGHSSASVTDAVYAQRDMDRVVEVMNKIG